jgi:hypothetical protein
MIHCPIWSYYPDKHDFKYVADVPWPTTQDQQLDWIYGMTEVETWLYRYAGSRYQYWAWHKAQECYHIGVAFRLAKHRTMFLLTYAC